MHLSTITVKGQTTIPKEIREFLHLKPNDKVVYIPDGTKVFLAPVTGDILALKGSVKHQIKSPIDFLQLREKVLDTLAKESVEKMR